MRGVSIISTSGNRNPERSTREMNFFRFRFASLQEIRLSNSLIPGHTPEAVRQTLLHHCGLRHLRPMPHKVRSLPLIRCHADRAARRGGGHYTAEPEDCLALSRTVEE